RGIVQLWSVVALIATGAVGGFLSGQSLALAVALAALIVTVGAAVLAVWKRRLPLGWLIISSAATSAGTAIAGNSAAGWTIQSARGLSFGFCAAEWSR